MCSLFWSNLGHNSTRCWPTEMAPFHQTNWWNLFIHVYYLLKYVYLTFPSTWNEMYLPNDGGKCF